MSYGDDKCVVSFEDILDLFIYVKKVDDKAEEYYQNKIGKLRDIFDIEIPHTIKSHIRNLTPEATAIILASAGKTVDVLDMERVKTKPYTATNFDLVRKSIKKIEEALILNMASNIKECECPEENKVNQYESSDRV